MAVWGAISQNSCWSPGVGRQYTELQQTLTLLCAIHGNLLKLIRVRSYTRHSMEKIPFDSHNKIFPRKAQTEN